jgi:hypothetical protein
MQIKFFLFSAWFNFNIYHERVSWYMHDLCSLIFFFLIFLIIFWPMTFHWKKNLRDKSLIPQIHNFDCLIMKIQNGVWNYIHTDKIFYNHPSWQICVGEKVKHNNPCGPVALSPTKHKCVEIPHALTVDNLL